MVAAKTRKRARPAGSSLVGSQVPRIRVVPEGDDHPRWDEVADFVSRLGVTLDEWQLDVLRVSLMRRDSSETVLSEDGRIWAAFAVAVCCPRQNGKNGILEMRELVGACLLGERMVIHTAHLADTSMQGFARLDDLIDANGWLSKDVLTIRRQNGHEFIKFRNGNRIRFRTRTRGGGRGFSAPAVIFDESMFLPEISMGSILPVISAQPDPQVWYMGSAVDQTIHEDGLVFSRVRRQALEGLDDRLAFFEWSLDYDDPALVPVEEMQDLASVAATNPAFGVRIMRDYVRQELSQLDPRTSAVERFGVGDWPRTDGADDAPITYADWVGLADKGSTLVDPVCLAFDVSPERTGSIAAAGRRADDLLHVEVIEHRPNTRWLPGRLAELCEQHEIESVVCDPMGPAGSLVGLIEEDGRVPLTKLSTRGLTEACGLFVDSVREQQLRHLGSGDLVAAVKGAKTRPLGDAWAWSRKSSSVDIGPLVAATLAVASAAQMPDGEIGTIF